MDTDPRDIAQELFDLLERGERDVIREADAELVSRLRDSLGLPKTPRSGTPITIPARRPGATVVIESEGEQYAVKAAPGDELPVEIDTRRGILVVDPDDPLARVQRSIDGLDAIQF